MIATPVLNLTHSFMGTAVDPPPPPPPPESPTSVSSPSSSIWADDAQDVLDQVLEDEASFSSFQLRQERWQELERKRLALHRMRLHLEQRIHDFVDREKRAKQQLKRKDEAAEDDFSADLETSNSLHSAMSSPIVLLPLDAVSHMDESFTDPRMTQDRRHRPRCVSPELSPKSSAKKVARRARNDELIFSDGQVYHGDLVDGLREGNGTNQWPNGQAYRGEWLANRRHGRGTHTWPDGRTATGQWYKGHLHGRVLVSWPNGASYDGECQAGQKHGRGVWIDAKGSKYNGNFFNDREHGFGTLTHLDGRKYRGHFQNGEKHGYGVQVWPTRTYDGEWANGKFDGQGKLVWSTGATYTGRFLDGSYHGNGVYTWPSGKKYFGNWDRGRKHGHGVYSWPSGKKYSGDYDKGKKHGFGRMEWADGRVYCGNWVEGKRWGRGVQTNSDGSVFHCGMWFDNEPMGSYTPPSSSSIADLEFNQAPEENQETREEVAVGSRLRLMTL